MTSGKETNPKKKIRKTPAARTASARNGSARQPQKGAKPKTQPQKAASKKNIDHPRPPVVDVVATKLLRDQTLRERVYLNNRLNFILAGALIISIVANVMLALREEKIRYFATDPHGKIMQITSLDQPVQSVNEVLNWATNALTSSYTFSFSNYRSELQRSRDNFTKEGWEGFQTALEESGNLKAVITNKFVTTAVPRGAPVIVGEGYMNGRYAWKIEVPILVTYQSANARNTQDLLVQAVIVRRSELEHPKGIGIAQIIAQ